MNYNRMIIALIVPIYGAIPWAVDDNLRYRLINPRAKNSHPVANISALKKDSASKSVD